MVSCRYVTPRKILFPLFANTPPEHCLRCLLLLVLPFGNAAKRQDKQQCRQRV